MDSFTYIADFLFISAEEDPADTVSVPMNEDHTGGSGNFYCVIAWNVPFLTAYLTTLLTILSSNIPFLSFLTHTSISIISLSSISEWHTHVAKRCMPFQILNFCISSICYFLMFFFLLFVIVANHFDHFIGHMMHTLEYVFPSSLKYNSTSVFYLRLVVHVFIPSQR